MPRAKSLLFFLLILWLAAFLRFYRIEAQSLWNDEGNSYQMTLKSPPQIVADAAADIHPPLYYFLLSAWSAVTGQSELALRGFSALNGIILVAIIYQIGKKSFDESAALAAAFFAAINPALIYYSQEMRMYELVAMLGAGCWWLVVGNWKLEARSWKLEIGNWLAMAIMTALGLYTHYSFAFIVIAINLYFLLLTLQSIFRKTFNPQLLITWLLPQALAFLFYLPWLPTALHQVTTWPSAREYPSLLDSILEVLRWLTLGPTGATDSAWAALIGVGILLLLGMFRAKKNLLAHVLWLIVPGGLTVAFGLFSAVFAKFLLIAVPALCVLLGTAFVTTSGYNKYLHNARTLSLLIIICVVLSLNNLYFNPLYARADYRGIAQFLNQIAREGDVILTNSPNQREVFGYYYTKPNVIPVARSRPLNVPEQIAELESISKKYKRIFVIYWGDQQADPQKVIESWLNETTFKAYDQWYGDVRLAAYAVNQTAGTMNQKVNTRFGDRLRLEGYSLNASSFAAGDILQLTLFWKTESLILNRYKIFVHVIGDPAAPPVAQHDSEPVGGLVLTTIWKPQEVVVDNHGVFLPLDLPRGEYKLAIGLYEVNDGPRLTLPDGSDKLLLGSINVK